MHPRLAIPVLGILVCGMAGAVGQTTNNLTPAQQAALMFMRGANFGNFLEYATGNPAANSTYSLTDFTVARAEGFDHIRLPVAWHLYVGPSPSFIVSDTIFAKVDTMVDRALSQGLAILIDLHNFGDFTAAPSANTNKFYAIWRQVASHYANRPSGVALELFNEPNGAATTAVMNPIYTEAIRQIRLIDPNRTIFIGPGNYNNLDELTNLRPPVDHNVIVTLHCYDPFLFTHQGAEWAGNDVTTTGVIFPGPPPVPITRAPKATNQWVVTWFRDYNTKPAASNPSSAIAFQSRMQRAHAWSQLHATPVHVGEFGCYQTSDAQSRVNFYQTIRKVMDEQDLGWAMWDWKAGFHYIQINGNTGSPDPPGMRNALFPAPQIRASTPGSLMVISSRGKTLVLERSISISPLVWQTVSTQTLVSSTAVYVDPEFDSIGAAFYRVKWIK